jgi:hypothetical protein
MRDRNVIQDHDSVRKYEVAMRTMYAKKSLLDGGGTVELSFG